MIRFACPICRTDLEARDQDAGSRISCPTCNQLVPVPLPSPSPAREITAEISRPGPPPLPPPAPPPPAGTQVNCPHCSRPLLIPVGYAERYARCPHCTGELEVASPKPARRREYFGEYDDARDAPRERRRRRYDDDYEDDEDDDFSRRRRRSRPAHGSAAGQVCSILSVVCGMIAFLFCPPLFGIAGLTLGIVGTVQSENKALGIVGIVLSSLGTVIGMMLGVLLLRGFR